MHCRVSCCVCIFCVCLRIASRNIVLFMTCFCNTSICVFFSLLLSFFFTVPPNIDDSLSSSDVIVRENSNVTLRCRASGSPLPVVKWKRDDNARININKTLVGELCVHLRFWAVVVVVEMCQNLFNAVSFVMCRPQSPIGMEIYWKSTRYRAWIWAHICALPATECRRPFRSG